MNNNPLEKRLTIDVGSAPAEIRKMIVDSGESSACVTLLVGELDEELDEYFLSLGCEIGDMVVALI